ncbi:MAG: hypothetical protein AB7V50_05065 [Vampirovibrionia bacterium]
MSCNFKINNQIFNDIELVLVDLSGVLFNYDELWLKQIGYMSQILAEKHSNIQGELFRMRAMIMKILGVDPETGDLDNDSCLFYSTNAELKSVLKSVLYLNGISWRNASSSVDSLLDDMAAEVDISEFAHINNYAKSFIDHITAKVSVVTYNKRSYENVNTLIKSNHIFEQIKNNYSLYNNFNNTLEDLFLSNICKEENIDPSKTLIIADSIYDLMIDDNSFNNRVLVNKNTIDNYLTSKYSLKYIINELKDIKII